MRSRHLLRILAIAAIALAGSGFAQDAQAAAQGAAPSQAEVSEQITPYLSSSWWCRLPKGARSTSSASGMGRRPSS